MPLTLDTWSLAALMLAALLLVMLAMKLRARLALSRAKHRSLAGHARLSRRIAALVPRYAFADAEFFAADDAPAEIADRRRAAFERTVAPLGDGQRADARPHGRSRARTSPTCNSPSATASRSRSAPP